MKRIHIHLNLKVHNFRQVDQQVVQDHGGDHRGNQGKEERHPQNQEPQVVASRETKREEENVLKRNQQLNLKIEMIKI